jgi:hypothetical protein
MKLATVAAVLFLMVGGLDASAHAGSTPPGAPSPKGGPAPSGMPSLLCTKKGFPGRIRPTTPSEYSYRPRICKLPAFTTPGREQSTHLLAIQWRRWTEASASGVGEIPIVEEHISTGEQREGRERVTIRLSRPASRCGRLVFTRAHVIWFYGGGINYHYRLHSIPVIGKGCPSD